MQLDITGKVLPTDSAGSKLQRTKHAQGFDAPAHRLKTETSVGETQVCYEVTGKVLS